MSHLGKRLWLSLALCWLLTGTLLADQSFDPATIDLQTNHYPDQITVQFKTGLLPENLESLEGRGMALGLPSFDALLQRYGITEMAKVFAGSTSPDRSSGMNDLTVFYTMILPPTADMMAAITDFGLDENIVWAGPVYIYSFRAVPNDPQVTQQYWLPNTTHAMKVYSAWDTNVGDSTIIFGNIDSGVNYRHPDLMGNIWVNPGEDINHNGVVFDSADINGVDNDGNGKIDDLVGWDFVTSGSNCYSGEDCSTADKDPMDMNGHGTFIAGIVAGVTNNAEGLAGIGGGWQIKNPGVRMMCLRSGWLTADSNGSIGSQFASEAVAYAITKGADVINMSFGQNAALPCNVNRGYYAPLNSAITNAVNAGIYVTHAAGNDALDCAEWKDMITGVTTVSALDNADIVTWFSNYGTWVDLSGPGEGIYSTDSWLGVPGYATYDGTSFSAPAVAAIACLLKSQQPTLTRAQLDTLIANHGENVDTLYNSATYWGKLGRRPNAFASMSALPDANFVGGDTAGNAPFSPPFTDASANSPTSWLWDFGNGQTSPDQVPTPPTYNNLGYYNVSLTITEPRGTNTHTKWNTVLVTADTVWIEPMYIGTGTDTIDIPVYLTNTVSLDEIIIPIVWKGSTFTDTMLNVIDVAGTRCAAFEQHVYPSLSLANKRGVIKLKADMGGGAPPLTPGSGVICKLRMKVVNAAQGQMACIRDTTYGTNYRTLTHSYYKYSGAYRSGCIMGGSAIQCGDANGDHAVDISDAVFLIAFIFSGGAAPGPAGNVNCDAAIDISDAVYLISFIFSGGAAPCAGC